MPRQEAQQEGMSVIEALEMMLGSSLPSVERTPEVRDRAEGAQRAGTVVVEPATLVVEVEVMVMVGVAAVAIAVIV